MMNVGAILEGPNEEFTLASWPVDPAPADVVLEVELCGLCGSDLHQFHGAWAGSRFPLLLGHEIVGRVAHMPDDARDVFGAPLRVGDRVVPASASFGECQRCFQCAEVGAPWACTDRASSGVVVEGREVNAVGAGLARYLRVPPPRSQTLLRFDGSAAAGVLHEPMSVAVQMVLGGPTVLGSDVVVQGSGAIGLLTVLVARAAGAARVVVVGGPAPRLEIARELGADVTVDIDAVTDPEERISTVRAATTAGLGAAVAYEIAGVPAAVTEGLAYLRPSGVLMEAGNSADTGTVALNPNLHVQRDRRTMIGVRGRRLRDFTVAGHLTERFADRIGRLVSHRLPLERVHEGLLALDGGYELDGSPVVKIVVAPT